MLSLKFSKTNKIKNSADLSIKINVEIFQSLSCCIICPVMKLLSDQWTILMDLNAMFAQKKESEIKLKKCEYLNRKFKLTLQWIL